MAVLSARLEERFPPVMEAVAAIAVGIVGWRLRWLTLGAAAASSAVGGLVFRFGGWLGAGALLTFFITSTLLGRNRSRAETRTATQVLANGGAAALAALWLGAGHKQGLIALAASLAAANADTWSTEIGMLLGKQPRSPLTLKPVSPGVSGGVTVAGLLGAGAGATVVALWLPANWLPIAAIGFGGSVLDSLLGAGVQARFVCVECGMPVETRVHCHMRCRRVSGLAPLDNNGVNATMTVAAALAGLLVH